MIVLPLASVTLPPAEMRTIAPLAAIDSISVTAPPTEIVRLEPFVVMPAAETMPTISSFASTNVSGPVTSAATVPMSFCWPSKNEPVPARYSSFAVMIEPDASLTPDALIATRPVPAVTF